MAGRKTYLLGFSYATAYTLSRRAPNYLVAESVVWTCLSLLTITLSINFIYSVIIFPIFLTPLRHLPQPKGNSLINGQFWKIFHEDNGKPHQQWMESIPNDGLIYYRSILNVPRVLVTTPDALREVLSQKNYEFVKPQLAGFARIVGNGVLLAEGDEHRVRTLVPPRYRRSLLTCHTAPAQEPDASLLLPSHKRPLSGILVQDPRSRLGARQAHSQERP